MNVYILMENDYESSYVLAVYSTLESAEIAKSKEEIDSQGAYTYFIDGYKVQD
jgi:hypothetical protein